jgi:hypothetical protein
VRGSFSDVSLSLEKGILCSDIISFGISKR